MDSEEFSALVERWRNGDEEAYSRLFRYVYDEIKRIASARLKKEGEHTYQTTDLAHEVFPRLLKAKDIDWNDREHFLNTAARLMGQILIDYARLKSRKVHGHSEHVDRDRLEKVADGVGGAPSSPVGSERLLDLQRAIEKAGHNQARWRTIAMLRLHFGMSTDEIATQMRLSKRTVQREWKDCKEFLAAELHAWKRPLN